MKDVLAENGAVLVGYQDGSGWGWETGPDEYSPAEARAFAAELLAKADEAERQLEQIRQACAGGHDWGSGWNEQRGDKRTTMHCCRRPGCREYDEQDGWIQYAGRQHFDPFGRDAECTGPGCEHCNTEQLRAALRAKLNELTDSFLVPQGGPFGPDVTIVDGFEELWRKRP